ncbi:hypothetical protein GUITHDRAFT_76890 [Guillardia theta CCMP2712]|uniref:EF-hand domain-containing protein n=1 Tax=Guillardia theta (strain CCMP2712) TaxID=905079 RepID=L1ISF9_GUITC|nr:hypothetical protein GUITHDRAFT_76890 [Guillardia theta CCMP2712]EKX38760.1 hypothetical protein GUITHDRAFT_76890 [Guillardia theta CCMP2712]|eukprot:XP_005825740.1 hypothetical protein GUITHDRAFT_76890 [Guillardia theta CCMP2712]
MGGIGGLTEDELAKCREAFSQFDADNSGTIEPWELKKTLMAMGQNPKEEQEEQEEMFLELDTDESGSIDFTEFVSIISRHKKQSEYDSSEADTIAAWIGKPLLPLHSGQVDTDRLRSLVTRFSLTIDIEALLQEADKDQSGFIDYEVRRGRGRD